MRSSLFVLALLLGAVAPAHAAILCVSDGAELQAAFHTARTNNQADEIRLRQGVYQRTANTSFFLNIVDGSDILVSGGWSGANDTCAQLLNDPSMTTIDAMATGRGLSVSLGENSPDFTVYNLRFLDGRPNPNLSYDSGTGLQVGVPPGNSSDLLVERCIFEGNQADGGSGLAAGVGGTITVRNSLFIDNMSVSNGAATGLTADTGIRFNNNTVTGNHSGAAFDNGAVSLYGPGVYVVTNNIIRGNTGPTAQNADLRLESSALLVANIIGVVSGTADAASTASIDADPRFVGPGDYQLRVDSPARDAGATPLGGAGSFDAIGRSRVQGKTVDIGAFEFEAVFRDGFEAS